MNMTPSQSSDGRSRRDVELHLQQLVSYFAEVSNDKSYQGIYNRLTAIGQPLAASDLRLVAKGLCELKWSRLLNCSKLFCDAGSADARVVALAAACFGMSSFGVEYDHRLVDIGREHIRQLQSMGIIRRAPAYIMQGDFCKDDTYKGVGFRDITTFYCFESNGYCLAEKIAMESPRGTLLVYFTQNHKVCFKGLQRLTTLTLQNLYGKCYYMHGFQKLFLN